jgi:hypothetical protein
MTEQFFKDINVFPLSWPTGWTRTGAKKRSQFRTTFGKARDELFRELKLLGVNDWNVILSSNIPVRRDGLPYAGQANPEDPGIAVYFRYKEKPMVFACDTYISAVDNLWAITKSIEALRGIKRWGASDMLERSFTGFQALPPARTSNWWEVLGVPRTSTYEQVSDAWKKLAKIHHPDKGGSEAEMSRLNRAWGDASRELK